MKGLTFVITEQGKGNIFGWDRIQVLDRYLFKTTQSYEPKKLSPQRIEARTVVIYEYCLDCICDGEFVTVNQDEFEELLAYGFYELEKLKESK